MSNFKSTKAGILMAMGLMLISGLVSAQSLDREVVSSQGGEMSKSGLSLEYTIGEAIVGTFSRSSISVTQGFNQVVLDTQSVSVGNVSLASEVKIYPNPASSILTVESEIEAVVEVFDFSGKSVMVQQNVSEGIPNDLNIQGLPAGVYVLRISGEEGQANIRWVKNE